MEYGETLKACILRYSGSFDAGLVEVLYREGELMLVRYEKRLYLGDGGACYHVSSTPYNPDTLLWRKNGGHLCIRNAFSTDEIEWLAQHPEQTLHAISSHDYTIGQLCRLLLFAGQLGDCDISYLERQYGALQPDTENQAVTQSHPHTTSQPSCCIPCKGATQRERIEEIIDIASCGEEIRAVVSKELKNLYASVDLPILPAAERFIKRYGYLFSALSPAFADEEDDAEFHFELFDELLEEERLPQILQARDRMGQVAAVAGCPVTPIGLFGLRAPALLYTGEDGWLYALLDDNILKYNSIEDFLEAALDGHPLVGLDD